MANPKFVSMEKHSALAGKLTQAERERDEARREFAAYEDWAARRIVEHEAKIARVTALVGELDDAWWPLGEKPDCAGVILYQKTSKEREAAVIKVLVELRAALTPVEEA